MRRRTPGAVVFRSGKDLKASKYQEKPYKSTNESDSESSSGSDSDMEDKRPKKKVMYETPSSATSHISETPNLNTHMAGSTPAPRLANAGFFGEDITQESLFYEESLPTAPLSIDTTVRPIASASIVREEVSKIMASLETYSEDMVEISAFEPLGSSGVPQSTSKLGNEIQDAGFSVTDDSVVRRTMGEELRRSESTTTSNTAISPTKESIEHVITAPLRPIQARTPTKQVQLDESFIGTQDDSQAHKRRIPGPAGQLPPLKSERQLREMEREQNVQVALALRSTQSANHPSRASNHSQRLEDQADFRNGAWMAMLCECDLAPYGNQLLNSSLAWIQQHGCKTPVPSLIVSVKSFRLVEDDYRAVFRDPTGAIENCIISRSVSDRFSDFSLGCVLQLKDVSVFTPSRGKHFLAATPENVVRIWPRVDVPRSELSNISARVYDYKCIYDPSVLPHDSLHAQPNRSRSTSHPSSLTTLPPPNLQPLTISANSNTISDSHTGATRSVVSSLPNTVASSNATPAIANFRKR